MMAPQLRIQHIMMLDKSTDSSSYNVVIYLVNCLKNVWPSGLVSEVALVTARIVEQICRRGLLAPELLVLAADQIGGVVRVGKQAGSSEYCISSYIRPT